MDRSLRRREILRRKQDIEQVLFRGRRLKDGPVGLYYTPGPAGARLVAFITAGKFRTNVLRNRTKRRLREIYRTDKDRFPLGFSFVLRGDTAASQLPFAELRERILKLADKVAST
jgi:ribonuclease P protein component